MGESELVSIGVEREKSQFVSHITGLRENGSGSVGTVGKKVNADK